MTNLSIRIDRNEIEGSALITWIPPYTLTNVPILFYIVMIDFGRNLTKNTTNSSIFLYQAIPEHFYVAVTPVNKVGKGKIAATSIKLCTCMPVTIAPTRLPQNTPQGM